MGSMRKSCQLQLVPRLLQVGGFGLFQQCSGINSESGPRNRLKAEPVAFNLDQHEIPVGIETNLHALRWSEVVIPEFPGIAQDEIVDALLRFQSFINMFMPRKYGIDSVLFEHRRQRGPQIQVGPVKL